MPGQHGQNCGCKHESEVYGSKDLLPYIELEKITALNELNIGSCKGVFRPYSDRLLENFICKSQEEDPDLIIFIPFVSPCTLHSLTIIGGDCGRSPNKVKIYVNDETIDFSNISDLEPTQEIDLIEDYCGTVEYPLKTTKFKNINLLVLYFPSTFDANQTWVYYIGIKGESLGYKRRAVTTVYESKPNISDHKNKFESYNNFSLK